MDCSPCNDTASRPTDDAFIETVYESFTSKYFS